jgi:lactobin A/cerein 7B family class IIb bacteriocin
MNLQELGVQEMTVQEIKEIDGGILPWIAGALLGGLLYDLVSEPGDYLDGFKEGMK